MGRMHIWLVASFKCGAWVHFKAVLQHHCFRSWLCGIRQRHSRQAPARAIPTNSAWLRADFPTGLISTGVNKQMKQMEPHLACRSAQGLS